MYDLIGVSMQASLTKLFFFFLGALCKVILHHGSKVAHLVTFLDPFLLTLGTHVQQG